MHSAEQVRSEGKMHSVYDKLVTKLFMYKKWQHFSIWAISTISIECHLR
jgi:hypothetical protein